MAARRSHAKKKSKRRRHAKARKIAAGSVDRLQPRRGSMGA